LRRRRRLANPSSPVVGTSIASALSALGAA
jgi:hypothetical protein